MSDEALDNDSRTDGNPAGDAGSGDAAAEKPRGRKRRGASGKGDDEDHVVDLEEELHPDDVEDPLDVLLEEKTASEGLDVDEAAVETDDTEPGERGANRIAPRQSDEFLCSSCFLVVPLSQLADKKRQLCRDCA